MSLTASDLQQIRVVMEETIATHPRFDQLKNEIVVEVCDQVGEVMNDALELIDRRFDVIEHRLDNLRIVTR